jgi:hypothetical protein
MTNDGQNITVHVLENIPLDSRLAVAIHELVEGYLCCKNQVTEQDVVTFDEQYEKEREEGKHGNAEEPGDDPCAPYRKEHRAATRVEREVCKALGISWTTHEQAVLESATPPTQSQTLLPLEPDQPHQSGSSDLSQSGNP